MAADIRQQPGFACEECRRRKARCDRVRPQCGTCFETGCTCIIVEKRPQRGPKKGQLKALRSRVATLERQLEGQLEQLKDAEELEEPDETHLQLEAPVAVPSATNIQGNQDCIDFNMGVEVVSRKSSESDEKLSNTLQSLEFSPLDPDTINVSHDWLDTDTNWPGLITLGAVGKEPPSHLSHIHFRDLDISDLMLADLDQLYFDRVHHIAPIIHKRRYFMWAGRKAPSPARACLRSAMRTVASAVSAQASNLSDALYAETRRMLEALDGSQQGHGLPWVTDKLSTSNTIQLEQIQAWLLLAHFEILRMQKHQTVLTARRAFSLVQLSRLYDIDASNISRPAERNVSRTPTPLSTLADDTFSETEERRRTFWLAFILDRFLCARDGSPLTLHEELICTRLPAPEPNFQNSQPIRMEFLQEAMAESSVSILSPFAECIRLAALHGRCMIHRQLAQTVALSSKETREFWDRHKWLEAALERRMQALATMMLSEHDHLQAFVHLLAFSIAIHLSNMTDSIPWQTTEDQLMAITSEQRAYRAVNDTVQFTKNAAWLSSFKAHPFMPILISRAASFLTTYAKASGLDSPDVERDECVEQLISVLKKLGEVSNLARELAYKLESGRSHGITSFCTLLGQPS